jgi:hypothetical protein
MYLKIRSVDDNMITITTEEFCLPGYNTKKSTESQPKFRRNMLPPSSGLLVALLVTYFILFFFFFCLDYLLIQKMEAKCSWKTLVDFQRTT